MVLYDIMPAGVWQSAQKTFIIGSWKSIKEHKMPLGENLIKKGLLSQDQLNKALEEQKKTPAERIGQILIRLGYVTKEQVESSL
jgi:hypothetical protein